MLLVILPVIALTFLFAWRYRASNTEATYDPDWHHSTQLEVVIWTVPLLIIIALGAMTWISTHTLDPYRPLARLAPNKPVPADVKPLTVEVVALDWKWLFIYPEFGVASVNEMAAPANVPISFKITSSSVWNTFYVPALAGMIYAMPGMETKLHAVMNKEGDFTGPVGALQRIGLLPHDLRLPQPQPSRASTSGWPRPRRPERPSTARPISSSKSRARRSRSAIIGSVEGGLFDAILGMCVAPGQMCVRRNAPHRHDGRRGEGQRGEPQAARLRQPPAPERRRALRRHLPRLGPPAEELR